jgi:hypothetical protein
VLLPASGVTAAMMWPECNATVMTVMVAGLRSTRPVLLFIGISDSAAHFPIQAAESTIVDGHGVGAGQLNPVLIL